MRLTYAIYLEISADYLLPGFFATMRQFNFGQSVDPGECRMKQEIFRLEIENVKEGEEPQVRQVVERMAERLLIISANHICQTHPDWREHGKLTVEVVENAPNPTFTHGMEGDNPSVSCPVCKSAMKRKQGSNGPFYGCSRFPECRGTRRISK